MNAQKLSQTLGAGDASATGTLGKIDIDIGMDIDKDTETQEQTQSPEKETQERTQSPDSALSDEQSSPRLGESKPDRSTMKLDLPPSPLRFDRQLSKSPSEPTLKLSQRKYSNFSTPNAVSSGWEKLLSICIAEQSFSLPCHIVLTLHCKLFDNTA